MSEEETLRRAWPTTWRKNSWHRYDMKKLRHCQCHPIHTRQNRIAQVHDYHDLLRDPF